jgi:hypothetical protein
MSLQSHIHATRRAIERGEQELRWIFMDKDLAEALAIECFDRDYHALRTKQEVRLDNLQRLERKAGR